MIFTLESDFIIIIITYFLLCKQIDGETAVILLSAHGIFWKHFYSYICFDVVWQTFLYSYLIRFLAYCRYISYRIFLFTPL